jgi:hypothetical protein
MSKVVDFGVVVALIVLSTAILLFDYHVNTQTFRGFVLLVLAYLVIQGLERDLSP